MPSRRTIAPSTAVLIAGCALRLVLAVVAPTRWAYDDHFEPITFILREHRLPIATDCWECYQPPLYYLLAAGPYAAASGAASRAFTSSQHAALAAEIGEKAVQFLSVVYGCLTLWLARRILRLTVPPPFDCSAAAVPPGRPCSPLSPWREALALSVVAFLPQHVHISAMATNDALTHLLATVAVYLALRAARPAAKAQFLRWALVGVVCGLAVLSKAYGWVTPAAIVVSLLAFARLRDGVRAAAGDSTVPQPANEREGGAGTAIESDGDAADEPLQPDVSEPRRRLEWRWIRPAIVVLTFALAVGIWPTVRNLRQFGRAQADNFDFFRTAMRFQPPGSFKDTEFLSFHALALWERPFLHVSHLRSFWTEMYGRFWFDYEPVHTLSRYPPWRKLHARAERLSPQWDQRRWNYILNYGPADVPADMAWIGRVSYAAGLPLTALTLAGILMALRRGRSEFALALLAAHLVFSLSVPLFQTLRLPHFSAMKAAFALGGLSSVPVLAAIALSQLRGRIAAAMVVFAGAAAIVMAISNAAYIVALARLVVATAR